MAMKTFLALYMGSDAPVDPASVSQETMDKGMAAWGQWMTDHAGAVVDHGGPLGKTKKAAADGVTDIRNGVAGYVIVPVVIPESAQRLSGTQVNRKASAQSPGSRTASARLPG
jgi:hypothetical protein